MRLELFKSFKGWITERPGPRGSVALGLRFAVRPLGETTERGLAGHVVILSLGVLLLHRKVWSLYICVQGSFFPSSVHGD